ncbi:MBL fold metallo-hydrolase [Rossellomorea sp. YZS02]|uniref:MBL fold metallo-hydrolase n=1 Tax=Rossellomorea sp. YZS02 TaxID=3097358 RepID=UPI002A0C79D0|nr:MBL fold metallo-hydrolase [Rossellomorea sp. YZS02]MDX8343640.1 MBL fold metallo-hydrolase [Rossellomorea sp. YZS02]
MIQSFKLTVETLGQKMPVYIFRVDDVLVDTGPYSMRNEVRSIVKELPINRVIHTHHHEDHTGNSAWIERFYSLPQWIHPLGVKKCNQRTNLPFYRSLFWHNRAPFHPEGIQQDVIETENHFFQIVHTPGHAEDHIVLIDEEKGICFSGDLYLFHSPTSNFSFESVPELIRSINKTLSYSFQEVYCSHQGHLKHGRKLLEKKRDYLLDLQDSVTKAYLEGKSAKEIRKQLFPRNKLFQYISFFENSPAHTIKSIIKEIS